MCPVKIFIGIFYWMTLTEKSRAQSRRLLRMNVAADSSMLAGENKLASHDQSLLPCLDVPAPALVGME